MIRKSREMPNEKQQLATCHLPINAYKMSRTTALKSHTAALPPSFHNSGCCGGVGCRTTNTAAAAMSSLAADLCKAATTKQATPPTEDAVVVNSIIYSKPSFCSIVVDIGDTDTTSPTEKATDTVTGSDTFSRISKPTLQSSTQTAGNEGIFPLPTTDSQNDAHVYMMCTTMNGAIHHHISEMCDNLIAAMGLFGTEANSEHDDDSLIEFAYDDADDEDDIEFLHTDEDYNRHDVYKGDDEEDDDDEDEEDYDSDDDTVEDYETDDEDACLYACGEDVTDFSKCPLQISQRSPLLYNYDKKKKVRFNTKPTVHVMRTWDYAYRAARKGEWEMYARDRERFKLRIQRVALTLNPILDREHRLKVYEQRFACLYAEQEDGKANDKPQPKKINQKQKHRKKRRKRRRPNF